MVSAQKIKYNGVFSNTGLGDLDIILDVAFDSDNGAMSSYLNRSAVASESHDGRYKNTAGYKYDELFSPQFTIVKKDFSDFTQEQVRRVLKYLTSTDKPALLEVYYDGDSNTVDWACIGGWTSIETYKIANSRTVGIVAKFEAITPYAMSDIYAPTKTISSANDNKITINIDTDDNKPVYPCITIQEKGSVVRIPASITFNNILDMVDYVENTAYYNGATYYWKTSEPVWRSASTKPNYEEWTTVEVSRAYTENDTYAANTFYHYSSGNMYYWIDPYSFHSSDKNPNLQTTSVKITNQHYDLFNRASTPVEMIVKNNTTTEKIVVDGANKVISSDRARRIFGDDFIDWQWLPLYDGKNEITVEGNCEVEIKYREIRKVGEY
jgi:hypothetical protein